MRFWSSGINLYPRELHTPLSRGRELTFDRRYVSAGVCSRESYSKSSSRPSKPVNLSSSGNSEALAGSQNTQGHPNWGDSLVVPAAVTGRGDDETEDPLRHEICGTKHQQGLIDEREVEVMTSHVLTEHERHRLRGLLMRHGLEDIHHVTRTSRLHEGAMLSRRNW